MPDDTTNNRHNASRAIDNDSCRAINSTRNEAAFTASHEVNLANSPGWTVRTSTRKWKFRLKAINQSTGISRLKWQITHRLKTHRLMVGTPRASAQAQDDQANDIRRPNEVDVSKTNYNGQSRHHRNHTPSTQRHRLTSDQSITDTPPRSSRRSTGTSRLNEPTANYRIVQRRPTTTISTCCGTRGA